jgi:hypothetical protein
MFGIFWASKVLPDASWLIKMQAQAGLLREMMGSARSDGCASDFLAVGIRFIISKPLY